MAIVCGTDFSPGAVAAIRSAAALARRLGDELWLVHALERSIGALDESARGAVEDAARARLLAESAEVSGQAGVAVRTDVIPGPAYETLSAFAERKRARLVVVASRGHADQPVYRLGGTSERLAQLARLPVLVVRDAGPFEAWARDARPLRILLGYDWTASSEAALLLVKALRESAPCDLVVGYVYDAGPMGEAERRYGLPPRQRFSEPDPELERLLARDLGQRVSALAGAGEVILRPRPGIGRVADHLLELADAERVDLIVVGTHRKSGIARLASVSGITLHYSNAAVACVPASEASAAAEEAARIDCVLVPTDLSPASNAAARHAQGLLAGGRGEIVLAHVLAEDAPDAEQSRVVAELRSLLPRHPSRADVAVRTEVVRQRDAAAAICELAERVGADVICMCSHGRGGLQRAVLGSVAEAVVRRARQPVLVVHPLRP